MPPKLRKALPILLCAVLASVAMAASAPADEDFHGTYWQTVTLPRVRAVLSSKVDENVATVEVEEGDRVKAGDPLVQFDSRLIEARIRTARVEADFEARKAAARTRRDFYADQYQRNLQAEPGVGVTVVEAEEALFQKKTAEIDLEELERSEELAEARLEYYRTQKLDYTVRSPIDGVVGAIWIEPGEMAELGEDLVEVIDPDVVEVRVRLPERYSPKVAPDRKVVVRFPAVSEDEFDGTVSFVAPYVESSSGLFMVKALVEPEAAEIKPGMRCELRFLPPQEG